MNIKINDKMDKETKSYIPNDDVVALSLMRAPNNGKPHDESRYVSHGLTILDSFVDITDEIIEKIRLV